MEKVKFNQMKDGTKEEYLFLDKHEQKYINGTADRLLKFMGGLKDTLEGYQITRLEHSLQTATRALRTPRCSPKLTLGKYELFFLMIGKLERITLPY